MKQEEFQKRIDEIEVKWRCRFHPFQGWHEVGCPHREWNKEDLLNALIQKKKFEQSGLRGVQLGNEKKSLDSTTEKEALEDIQ